MKTYILLENTQQLVRPLNPTFKSYIQTTDPRPKSTSIINFKHTTSTCIQVVSNLSYTNDHLYQREK